MAPVQVKRWKRFGMDRLYVNDIDGSRIGWWDYNLGEPVIERLDLADEFEAALASEGLGPRPTPRVNGPIWIDLAQNKPGQAARAKADAKSTEPGWQLGADGEEVVGEQLASLARSGWRVLHAVGVGRADCDIDHVVIGPGGTYSLNTKNHTSQRVTCYEHAIYVGGYEQDYLWKSRYEGNRARKLLTAACRTPVEVQPAIVVLSNNLTIKQQPAGVHVIAGPEITNWLRDRQTVLTATEIDVIWEQARRSTTWRPVA